MDYMSPDVKQSNPSTLAGSSSGPDRLGYVSDSVDSMTDNMRNLIIRLSSINDRLGGAVPEPDRASADRPRPTGALEQVEYMLEQHNRAIAILSEQVGRMEAILGR